MLDPFDAYDLTAASALRLAPFPPPSGPRAGKTLDELLAERWERVRDYEDAAAFVVQSVVKARAACAELNAQWAQVLQDQDADALEALIDHWRADRVLADPQRGPAFVGLPDERVAFLRELVQLLQAAREGRLANDQVSEDLAVVVLGRRNVTDQTAQVLTLTLQAPGAFGVFPSAAYAETAYALLHVANQVAQALRLLNFNPPETAKP